LGHGNEDSVFIERRISLLLKNMGRIKNLVPGLFLAFCLALGCDSRQDDQPNVVFILSDDQGWGDLYAHGNPLLQTPNLDRLIQEGLEFERFFVSPLCAPTRASLLTGRYHLRTGVTSVSNGYEVMDADETTLAELFKANGYRTGCFGKWHNGSHFPHRPEDQGFDEFIGFCAGHLTNYFNTGLDSLSHTVKTQGYITDILTDRAIDFIGRNKDQPFFCYLPYNAPHSPFQLPDAWFDKYKAMGLDDELASLYGMVDHMDYSIGRVLKSLEETGLEKNTIVIFMSDNGPNGVRFNGGMKGIKGQVDEGGVRVPALIRWPEKIEAGRKINQPLAHIDWYPTLTGLCGLDPVMTKPIDGMDFSTQILGHHAEFPSRTLFTHVAFLNKNLISYPGAVRTATHRLVVRDTAHYLYDLVKDPGQTTNLAPEQTELAGNLKNQYDQWFASVRQGYKPEKAIALNTSHILLPAYEAEYTGNLRFAEGHGWAHDWLVNWSSTADTIRWLVESDTMRVFEVLLKYTCPPTDLGSVISVRLGEQSIQATVTDSFDPPFLPSPDRVKRKEAYEKEWANMRLGAIRIPGGKHHIKLIPVSVKHKRVSEVAGIELIEEE